LRLAADFFALFELARFALFNFAATVGVFVANGIARLAIERFKRAGIVGLEANGINHDREILFENDIL
jgi:hypothetical protein